jgi:hypothetical protein
MKKSIKTLISKLEVSEDGKVKGGFKSIRGGSTSLERLANNDKCNNQNTCSSNNDACSNGVNCTNANNSTNCTNTMSCFSL